MIDELEPRQMFYAVGESGTQAVHQWISRQGMDLFIEEFGPSQISSLSNGADVIQGTGDEDAFNGNPFADAAPYLRHFWGHDAAFNHALNNGFTYLGIQYDSAPRRAIDYFNATGFGLLGWSGGGIARRYVLNDRSTHSLSYQLLGHAAHLLQDLTVPAHAHNDDHNPTQPDPFHTWIDGGEVQYRDSSGTPITEPAQVRHTNFGIRSGSSAAQDLRAPRELVPGSSFTTGRFNQQALVTLFRENVELADNYDSRDVNGQLEKGKARRRGIFAAYTSDELASMARVLVPRAIISTAELIRLFYGTVDSEAPTASAGNLKSKDPAAPQIINGSTFDLLAMASDAMSGDSGVGKDKFQVEYREVAADGTLGSWQKLANPSSAEHFNSAGSDGPANAEFAGRPGALASYRFQGRQGATYQIRIRAEDGAGNVTPEDKAPVYHIRMGPPAASVVQVIDHSGSMSGAKIDAARVAAGLFTQLLSPGDRIGIAQFDDTAETLVGLTTISSNLDNIDPIVQTINGIQPSGATAIGDGLAEGESILSTISGEVGQAIILLSDGQNNSGVNPEIVVQRLAASGIRVFTIAFGSDADDALMNHIAAATGGKFYDVSDISTLNAIYAEIVSPLSGLAQPLNASGTVGTGQVQTQTVTLTAAQQASFGLNWASTGSAGGFRTLADGTSRLVLKLTSPSGRVYRAGGSSGETFSDSFDNYSLSNWIASSPWGLAFQDGQGGTAGVSDSPSGNYRNNASGTLTLRQAYAVPAGGAGLKFWHKFAFENGKDFGYVEARPAGSNGAWTQLTAFTGQRDAGYSELSLDAFAGQSISLRFRVATDASGTADGWTIDSIRIAPPVAATPGVHVYESANYALIRVDDPTPGDWSVAVEGVSTPAAGQSYNVFGFLNAGAVSGLAVSNAVATERALVRSTLTFDVTLSAAAATPISVNYHTMAGTALAGFDYEDAAGVLTFAPGETRKQVSIRVLPDAFNEEAESLSLVLENATGGVIADPRGEGTIREGLFRIVDFRRGSSGRYTDENGHDIAVAITGAGRGQLVLPLSGNGIEAIVVSGGDQSSRLTVNYTGITSVPMLDLTGDWGVVDFSHADLTAGLTARGNVKSATFRNVNAGEDVEFNGPGSLTLTALNIRDTRIAISGKLASFRAASWKSTTDAPNALAAASVGDCVITGDLEADLRIGGKLRNLQVGRAVREASINAMGGIETATLGSLVDSRIVVGMADDGQMPDSPSDFASRQRRIGSLVINTPRRGASFVRSTIIAPKITMLDLGRINTGNGGEEFGAAFRVCNELNGKYSTGRRIHLTGLDQARESVSKRDFRLIVLG